MPGRVLIWRNVLLPPSETFVVDQARALRRWEPVFAGLYTAPGLAVPDPTILRGFQRQAVYRGLSPKLNSLGADVVHAHFLPDAARIEPYVWRSKLPFVVTAHGYDVAAVAAADVSYERVFDTATAIVAVSGFIADELRRLGAPEAKLRVLRIGIPLPAEPPPPPEGREGVVFVGRLVPKKGVDHLLRAVPAGVPVRIVGDGPERAALEALARERGVDATFLGTRDPDGVRAELRRAAVFCGPSLRAPDGDAEGFGLVFLEAAAAGLPVVAYRSGGVPEAVQDGVTGLLAPEGDEVALAAHLRKLLDDAELRATLGAAGADRVRREYEIGERTLRLEALYDEVSGASG